MEAAVSVMGVMALVYPLGLMVTGLNLAWPIGEPSCAECQRADENEKNGDADHCGSGLAKLASAAAAM